MPDMHIYMLLKHAREKEKNTPVPDMHIYRLLKHAREKEKNTPVPDMHINVAEMCNRKGKKDHINARNVLKCCRNVQAKKENTLMLEIHIHLFVLATTQIFLLAR